eukprot:scaffold2235_cov94-Phaeocystis_antarctica.AAC.2
MQTQVMIFGRPEHPVTQRCRWSRVWGAAFPTLPQNDNSCVALLGPKKGLSNSFLCSSRPPFTRSVEFPKVALLAHGTRTRP